MTPFWHGKALPALLALLMLTALAAVPARAQNLNFGAGGGEGPIEIVAENGIEWQQEGRIFLARGNAKAIRDDTEVAADVLRAYYRETPGQGTEIWRMDAEGSVVITTPTEKAFGQKGVYDVDSGVFVLSGGKRVRLETKQDTVSASGQLEYWESKDMAVARGDAVAVRADKRLRADVLAAHFAGAGQGNSRIKVIKAYDNVRIDTEQDTVTARRGVYDVETGIATLTGSVKMRRGNNTISGCKARVDLNTGISKLFSCKSAGAAGPRVQGVLAPDRLRQRKDKAE